MKRFCRVIAAAAVVLALVVALIGPADAQLTRRIGNYILTDTDPVNGLTGITAAQFTFACNMITNQGLAAYNAASLTIGGARPTMTLVVNPDSGLGAIGANFLACLPNYITGNAAEAAASGGTLFQNTIELFLNNNNGAIPPANTLANYRTYGGAVAAMTTECLFLDRVNWTNAQLLLTAADADVQPTTDLNSGQGRLSYIVNGLAEYVKNCVYTGGPLMTKGRITTRLNQGDPVPGQTAFLTENTAAGASTVSGQWGWLGAGDGYFTDVNANYTVGGAAVTLGFGDIGLGYETTGLPGVPTAPFEVTRLTALGFFVASGGTTNAAVAATQGAKNFRSAATFVGRLATAHATQILTATADLHAISVVRTFENTYQSGIPGTVGWDDALVNSPAGTALNDNPFSRTYDEFWYNRMQN